jgi:hypothetical protein
MDLPTPKPKYRITVKPLTADNSERLLTFRVEEYKVVDGGFIEFYDSRTLKIKRIHASNVEIELDGGAE